MFRYRAITANCGNDILGTEASKRIIHLLRKKNNNQDSLDFCVINYQEVHFDKAKKELEQALKNANLAGYSITLVGKMTTPTKLDSPTDIQNALWGNTGMASFIIHKQDIKIHVESVEEARRNSWAIGTAYNKGGLVSRCRVSKASNASDEVIDIELVSGHLDSNKIAERAQDWGVIQKKLRSSSKKITDFESLSKAIPQLRLSGYDANTRNKIINRKVVNLWREDAFEKDAFELDGLKQVVLGNARYSAESTYKTEDENSAKNPSLEKKRHGYTKGGMLDFVDILDGTQKHFYQKPFEIHKQKGVITIGPGESTTKRDHAVVISPERTYRTVPLFEHTRDQIAAMLEQTAPKLAEDIQLLMLSPENEKKLLDIYHIFLSQEGLLGQSFDIFREKLVILQRVGKQKPEDTLDVRSILFPHKQAEPWFVSVSLDNFKHEAGKIQKQYEITKNKIKTVAEQYPTQFNSMKSKLWHVVRDKSDSPPQETVIEAEAWDLEKASNFYTIKYKHETWYKAPEKTDEGHVRIPFPDSNTAIEFGEAIAKKGLSFMIVDDVTGDVLAYSHGGGALDLNKEKRTLDEIRSDILAHKNQSSSNP